LTKAEGGVGVLGGIAGRINQGDRIILTIGVPVLGSRGFEIAFDDIFLDKPS